MMSLPAHAPRDGGHDRPPVAVLQGVRRDPEARERDTHDRLVVGGLRVSFCTVSGQVGDGVALGHPSEQTGLVRARIDSLQIFDNAVGIRVRQRDAVDHATISRIAFNNVYSNRDGGIHLATSYQLPNFTEPDFRFDVTPFAGNDVHHNAVQSADCAGPQTAAQIVWLVVGIALVTLVSRLAHGEHDHGHSEHGHAEHGHSEHGHSHEGEGAPAHKD